MYRNVSVSFDQKDRINYYVKKVDQLYLFAIREAASIGLGISNYDPSKPFTWSSYPQTKARIDKLIDRLYLGILTSVNNAIRREWLSSSLANDKIVDKFFSNKKLNSIRIGHYYQRNLEALLAFQTRKINGLSLSDRIWNSSQQFRNELEMCLDVGLSEGRSAAQLSRDIRKYLNEPDRLYRRIKDRETGGFYLSQNAKKYNPGSGMYRSSYKNALRVTRTETNMAYRKSDMERYQQLDFVVGYEVRRSNRVYDCDVCSSLAGKYPKSFVFTSWHPNCLCYTVSILATPDEFIAHQKRMLAGEDSELASRNAVTSLPDNFKNWARDNADKISNFRKAPYFLRDNFTRKELSNIRLSLT